MKFLAALSFFACAVAQGQTLPVTCSAGTLTGARSLVLTGRDVDVTGAFSKTYYGVGIATFDGVGDVAINLTVDTNVSQDVAQTLSGTYTIGSNCIGTLNIATGDTAAFTLIPYNSGKSFSITGYDSTYNFTGTGGTSPSTCLTSTLSGDYAYSGNGFSIAASVIAGIDTTSGLLTFDGAGSVSGSWFFAEGGILSPVSVAGHYSITSSCLANATFSDNSGNVYSLAMAMTSSDGANFTAIGHAAFSLFEVTGHSTFTNPGLSVGNAAGVTGGTPPGSLFSIYGSDLSSGQAQPTSFPLPLTAANATVTVNNESVPLVYVDTDQINAQLPLDIGSGVATLVVKNGTVSSNAVAITVPSTPIPGIYIYGSNHAVAQNFPSYTLNSSSAPAAPGDVVIVYLNGGGPVNGETSIVTGQATPNGSFPVTAGYSATIAGEPATIDFLGLVSGVAGLYQANIVVPKVASGTHPLIITLVGVASNSAQISVQ